MPAGRIAKLKSDIREELKEEFAILYPPVVKSESDEEPSED